MKKISLIATILLGFFSMAQKNNLTPELLWKIKRVNPVGITKDKKNVVFSATAYDVPNNKKETKNYIVSISGGTPKEISKFDDIVFDKNISSDGSLKVFNKEVKLQKILGKDNYPTYQNSNVYIFNDLAYRHWDTWFDGTFNHVFIKNAKDEKDEGYDLMPSEPYDSPQKPFGGDEDYIWNNEGTKVLYVAKKKFGKEYALSTNTDIYEYDIKTKTTKNITEGKKGYDMAPAFSSQGILAFLSMERDGYEADKNDIIVRVKDDYFVNLTKNWDGTVPSFKWSEDGKNIYFVAPVKGTSQLFVVDYIGMTRKLPVVTQITQGNFDVNDLVSVINNTAIVTRTDMNHASELFSVDIKNGKFTPLSKINDEFFNNLNLCKVESRVTKSIDGKDLFSWVIYPPNFDPNKKYPTLLYCQGGPQSALSQFYSFRWNFQLMASEGYIVIAPNRRGMPGWGTQWNEDISKDWGGKAMQDYLYAIDDLAKEKYVDKDRLGAVGASYGGYSIFYLAGIHNKRFKTFIAHDGVFDLVSMYGTTEEIWFPNWDSGGAYYEKDNAVAQKTYSEFNPINKVNNWDTPIMIIQGGKDYRVPIGQGLEAFQAAQLKGIKSRLLYFPDENHWVLNPQNSVIWHTEFYKWLKETLQ